MYTLRYLALLLLAAGAALLVVHFPKEAPVRAVTVIDGTMFTVIDGSRLGRCGWVEAW